MGFKAISTSRSSATSAVSKQAVTVNTGTGNLSVAGASITANTSVSLAVTTPGQSSANSAVAASGGPTITSFVYLDANNNPTSANAVSTSGGNIRITGTGFAANASVYINNSLVTNTFVSTTQIRAICPAASAGNVSLFIFNPTNVGALSSTSVRYSGAPTWTTAAVSFQNGAAANVALVASSDSTLTYTLQDGSTLPTGISLQSAGYLAGTATGYSTNTSSTAVIIATDQEGQATQQTLNITVTVSDPQFNYTTLLLNGETTVTPFINDASTNSLALTIAGDTRADKASPYYGDGYYSNYFGGSSDYLSLPANANTVLGSNDFTFEGWMYFNDVSSDHSLMYWNANISGYAAVYVKQTSGKWAFWVSTSGGAWAVQQNALGSTIVPGTWYHVAVVRIATNIKLYINGSDITAGGYSVSGSLMTTYTMNQIGVYNTSSNLMAGYISNLRLVNGTGIYTTTFTPPTTPLTAVANTALLTCQSNRFIDKSTNAFSVTLGGAPKISAAIPFAASSSYATYGSAYFDGNGDSLSTASSTAPAFGTGDFTVQFWVYPTVNARQDWFDCNTNSPRFLIYYDGTNIVYYSTSARITGSAMVLNTWQHIALSRASGSTKMFINGVQTGSTFSDTINYTSSAIVLGKDSAGSTYVTGYMSDVQVVKGTALYTTNFTPPTAPLTAVANTSLLTLQYNGGANNYGAIDTGPLNNPMTRSGNASQGPFSPYSQTGWSNYFDGTGDYLSVTGTDIALGAGDFTIEFWINGTYSGTKVLLDWAAAPQLYMSGTSIIWYWNADRITGTLVSNTWQHVAIVRASGVTKMYVNGTANATTFADTTNLSGTTLTFGGRAASTANTIDGYMSNLRLVKGTAVYTTNFTPSTTPLTAVSGTSFLTCKSNRFVDTSTNAYTISVGAGTPQVQAFSPFAPSAAYTPSLHGGSAYFDGVVDKFAIANYPNLAFGTNDFTVQCWFYTTVAATEQSIFTNGWAAYAPWLIQTDTSGNLVVLLSTSGGSWAVNTTVVTAVKPWQWYHVAVTRASGTLRVFVNGVQAYTVSLATALYNGSQAMHIGGRSDTAAQFNGYMTDCHLMNGTALYTSNFTPPTTPQTAVAGTTFLCNFTNGGIVDAHSSNVLESAGNTQLSTSVKKFGSSSMYFDGNGDYLECPLSQNFSQVGVWTVEMWIYPTASNNCYLYSQVTSSFLQLNLAATMILYVDRSGVGNLITAGAAISLNTWTHIALVSEGSTVKLYINGTQSGSTANYSTVTASAATTRIGAYQNSGGSATLPYTGYIDDLRVTRGFARYSANFTPPTSGFLGQ